METEDSLLLPVCLCLVVGRLAVEKYPVLCAQKLDYMSGSGGAPPATSSQPTTREKPQTVRG